MTPLVLKPAATQVDWSILAGSDGFDIHVPVLDADDNPVDVTGWTVKAQVRRSPGDPLLHEWSTADSNATVAGTDVVLTVDPAVTALWAWTDAEVSVVVYEPSGKPHTIAEGAIHAEPTPTH